MKIQSQITIDMYIILIVERMVKRIVKHSMHVVNFLHKMLRMVISMVKQSMLYIKKENCRITLTQTLIEFQS